MYPHIYLVRIGYRRCMAYWVHMMHLMWQQQRSSDMEAFKMKLHKTNSLIKCVTLFVRHVEKMALTLKNLHVLNPRRPKASRQKHTATIWCAMLAGFDMGGSLYEPASAYPK